MNDPLCPQCGESPGADGLCPRCLLGAFLEMGDGESDAPCVVGERFGNYERMEPMGRGGMGVVWRARQWPLGRVVALKMIRSGPGESAAETLARFRAEENALAALQHPHIIPIIEAGTAEGQLFYTMPLVEGGSLAGVLDGSGPAETASLRPVLTTPDGIASLIITAARAVH